MHVTEQDITAIWSRRWREGKRSINVYFTEPFLFIYLFIHLFYFIYFDSDIEAQEDGYGSLLFTDKAASLW